MLDTCLHSLQQQVNAPPFLVMPVLDEFNEGAAVVRQRGLDAADTEWVGFIDSDDWAYPDHVATLYDVAMATGADYVYSYFTIHDMWEGARPDLDPLATFGVPFNNAAPHQTTGTILVRKSALQEHYIQYRDVPADRFIPGTELRYGEDWELTLECARKGLKIVHVPRRTWAWRIGHHNTSGLPGCGDAAPEEKGT